jgi:hypothetical protein
MKQFVMALAALLSVSILPFTSVQKVMADDQGLDTSTSITLQTSTLPEAKIGITQRLTFPFLQGSNPFTEGNNLSIGLTGEISPISLNGIAQATWTPIAFAQIVAGVRLGTGWNINLFGGPLYGTKINQADGTGKEEHVGDSFGGLFWKVLGGAALQFDLAAVWPGDWHHVLFRTYHEINYNAYTGASGDQSWHFENDSGENFNGLNYYGNLVLAYQMPYLKPFIPDTVGFMAEVSKYAGALPNSPNPDIWGGDLVYWTLSGLFNFSILPDRLSASVIVQFDTANNYTFKADDDLYYRNRTVNRSDPQRLKFYRAALIVTYTL